MLLLTFLAPPLLLLQTNLFPLFLIQHHHLIFLFFHFFFSSFTICLFFLLLLTQLVANNYFFFFLSSLFCSKSEYRASLTLSSPSSYLSDTKSSLTIDSDRPSLLLDRAFYKLNISPISDVGKSSQTDIAASNLACIGLSAHSATPSTP